MDDLDLDLGQNDAAPIPQPKTPDLDLDLGQGVTAAGAVMVGSQENPDQAAKLRQLSKASGLSPELVKADPKQVELDLNVDQAQQVVKDSPHLTGFLANNPQDAEVIHDDLGPLANLGKLYSGMTPGGQFGFDIGKDFGTGIKGAISGNELGRQGSKLILQRDMGEDTSATTSKIRDLRLEEEHFPQNPGILSATGLGQLVGGIVDNINHSLPIFLGATGIGALTGSGVGGVGAVPGAAGGAVFGLIHGMAADAAKINAGQVYLQLDQAKDSQGNPLPESVKQGGAALAGVAAYGFNAIGGWHVQGFAREALSKEFANQIVEQFKNDNVAKAVGRAAMAIGESAATGGAIMMGQSVSNTLADTLATVMGSYMTGADFKNILNDKEKLATASQQAVSAFVDGASLFALMRVPAAGANMVSDFARVREAQAGKVRLDEAFNAAKSTVTSERAPEVLKDYLAGINDQKVYVPVDVVRQLYQGTADGVGHLYGAENGPLGYVKGLEAQVRRAQAHGGDVEIGLADYFAHTAPEVHEQLSEHLRQDPQALTAREAANLEVNPPNYWESLDPNRPKQILPNGKTKDGRDFKVTWNDEEATFVAHDKDGNKIGELADAFPVGKGEKPAFTALVEVHPEWQRHGVATELYRQFAERHEGNIRPAGNSSEEAFALWKSNYPDKLKEFVEQNPEVAKFSDVAASVLHPAVTPEASAVPPKVDSATGLKIHQDLTTQIDVERKNLWLDPMFKNPQAAGMSKRQFELYSKHLQEVQKNITEGVYRAVDKEIARRETKLWNDAVGKAVDEVHEEKAQEPVHFADSHLRTGVAPNGEKLASDIRIKLDPNTVDVMYGGVGAREGMHDSWFSSKGGMHPDDAAPIFGFKSGREMMDALAALEAARRGTGETPKKHFDRLVKEEAMARVESEHGKLEERILQEAIAAALDVKQVEVLIDEMSHLAQGAPISKEALQAQAKKTHEGMSTKQGRDSKGFEREAGKHGRMAEMALLKGDYVAAFQAKQNQLINFLLAKQAKAFDRAVTRLEATMDKFGKNPTLASIGQEYTDQIHLLMRAVDEKIPRSDENLEAAVGRTTVEAFVREKETTTAEKYDVAPWLQKDVPTRYADMNVEQVNDLMKAINSIEHNGREAQKIYLNGKAEELKAVTGQIASNVQAVTDGKMIDWQSTGTKTKPEKASIIGRLLDSELLKVEQLAQWWDKRDPTGPFNTYVIRPLKEAQHWRDDMVAKTGKKIKALFSSEVASRLHENVDQNLLMDINGRPQKLNRGNIIMMALNIGSESNLEVLTKGRNWDKDAVVKLVNDTLTPAEKKFVNGMHAIYADLWPHVQRVTKELTGVAIERVTAVRNGDLTGGYFPLMRDVPLSDAMGKGDRTDAYFNERTFDPFADATALHSRTGATYPLDLTFTQLPWKLRELIHGIAYRIPVKEAAKIINDKTVIKAINDGFGPEYTGQLNPWLHYIARDGNTSDLRMGFSAWQRWAMEARSNSVVATIGLRGSTTLIHTAVGLLNSIGETGALEFTKASGKVLLDMARGDFSTLQRVYEESGEIRNAAHNLDRDLGAQRDKMLGDNKFGTFRRQMMLLETSVISAFYTMSAVPTFIAAKEMHLKKGLSEADAIYAADQVLRNAHGSTGAMDLSAISRNQVMKNFTMFYQTFNHIYNRQRDMARVTKEEGPKAFGKLAFNTTMYILLPALIHGAVNEPMKEDGDPASWFGKQLLGNEAATIPMVRDVIYGIEHGRVGGDGPLSALIKSTVDLSKDAHHAADGDEAPKWVEHAATFFAYLTGIGTKSTSKMLQGGINIGNGTIDPKDIDLKQLFLRGDVKEKGAE